MFPPCPVPHTQPSLRPPGCSPSPPHPTPNPPPISPFTQPLAPIPPPFPAPQVEGLTAALPLWVSNIGDRRRLERGWLGWRLWAVAGREERADDAVARAQAAMLAAQPSSYSMWVIAFSWRGRQCCQRLTLHCCTVRQAA